MTREEKIESLLEKSDSKNLALERLFLNQKTEEQLDEIVNDTLNGMNNLFLESINS